MCRSSDECRRDQYCEKGSCGEAEGLCQPIPESCDSELSPVCGCDGSPQGGGITFFNDCWRRFRAVESARPGPCEREGRECSRDEDCPLSALCSLGSLFGGGFGPPMRTECPAEGETPRGQCWVIPQRCPDTFLPRYRTCDGGDECLDVCTVMRLSTPFTTNEQCIDRFDEENWPGE